MEIDARWVVIGATVAMWALTGSLIWGGSLAQGAPPWYYVPIGAVLSTIATILLIWRRNYRDLESALPY
jgi:hypothetical protein